jgi:peptidoglycan/xylan/chitin deacetylase (PgdA/CDA1 family)
VADGSETGEGQGSRVIVPCYHAVSETWTADLSVTPDRFEAQLATLVRRGYRATGFSDALRAGAGEKVVAITFDDAFLSVYDLAFPLMRSMGLVGTVFVPTAWPGRDDPMQWDGIDQWVGGPHEGEMGCLGWDRLRELADRGWEVGSHTRSHPHLTQLGDGELREELERSREETAEALGRDCPSIAYPYGDVDDRVVAAAEAAGYSYGATLSASIPEPTPLRWPRTGIYHGDRTWRWRLKLSPAVVRARASRAGAVADRVRGV